MRRAPFLPPARATCAVVLLFALLAVSGCVGNDEPGRVQHHATPLVLSATSATGTGWTNPSAATTTGDATYAATSLRESFLTVGLANSTFTGTITAVTLKLDQQQVASTNDKWTLFAYSPTCGAFGSNTLTNPTPRTTSTRSTLSSDVTCTAGWSWLAINNLAVFTQAVKEGSTDGEWRIYHAWIEVTFTNNPPVANAGPDQTVVEGSPVALTGAGSSDAELETLTYAWTQLSGTSVSLAGPTTALPSFTAPAVPTNNPAALVFRLTATDTNGHSSTDTVTVTVNNINQLPSAHAGPDQSVPEASLVTLTGLVSADGDSDTLTYAWTQTGGTAITLSSTSAAQPTFTAPIVPTPNPIKLSFSLIVNDGTGNSVPDTVTITVANVNALPTANAGMDQTINEAATVTLSGTASDADGDTVTYAWTQTSGTTVTLSDPATAGPTFTAPTLTTNAPTVLEFQLIVNDGLGASAADTVTIAVHNLNAAPVANAGTDQTVQEGAGVTLDATGSTDPDSDTITVAWTQTAGPNVALSSGTGLAPTFTAPTLSSNVPVVLTFQATAADPLGANAADTVTITVQNVNQAPVAIAGPGQQVNEGAAVQLAGSASNDAESDSLTFTWTQTSGPTVTLTGANTANPSFMAPTLASNAPATLVFRLVVSDGSLSSSPATVSVDVANINQPPIAAAGADQTVAEDGSVQLTADGSSDADVDPLTFRWIQETGPSVTLSSANQATVTFTAPTLPTNTPIVLTFSLVVSDGFTSSIEDVVTITVTNVNGAPSITAGNDESGNEGTLINLQATASDGDDDDLLLAWSQIAGPTITLADDDTLAPSFTAPFAPTNADVVLRFRLTASDGIAPAVTDDVLVTIQNINEAPLASAGPSITPPEATLVELQGTASDADADALTFVWTQESGPTVTLADDDTLTPSFTAPALSSNTAIVFEFRLIANDGIVSSSPTTVVVTIQNVNAAPVADVGADQIVASGALAILDGTLSADPEGETLQYAWTQTAGTGVTLVGATTDRPSFVAPTGPDELIFQLVVTDEFGTASLAVSSVVTVNTPPVAVITTTTATATTTATTTATIAGPTTTTISTVPGPTATSTATVAAPTVTVNSVVTTTVQVGGGGGGGVVVTTVTTTATNVVRLVAIPSSALVEGGERIPVAVIMIPPTSIASSIGPTATCVWDASSAGGTFEPGLTSCEGTFVASAAPGNDLALRVDVSVPGSKVFSLEIPIFKGLSVTANPDDDTIHDVALPPVAGGVRVPVTFPIGHALDLVLLTVKENVASGAFFETRELPTVPGDPIPGALTDPAFVIDINLLVSQGSAEHVPVGASLQFSIQRTWLETNCPAVTCRIQLFHFTDGQWTALQTTPLDQRDDDVRYLAPTESFSLFAAAGVALPPAVVPTSAEPSLPLIPILAVLVVALALSATTAGVVTLRKRRQPTTSRRAHMGPGFGELVKTARHQEVIQFVNSAAHDLATPLTTLNIQLYLLLQADPANLTREQKRAYDAMGRNLEQMRILVNDLRDAARHHAGQLKIRPVEMDVAALVEDIAADYNDRAERAGIRFQLQRPDTLTATLDPHRIRQALGNLLDNAIRYTGPGGEVRLAVEQKHDDIEFRVEDQGLGLSPEQKTRLFAPFVQVHDDERKRQGSGLGLFICKGIAEGHGGRIWVESDGVGKGSTFHLLIPQGGEPATDDSDPQA